MAYGESWSYSTNLNNRKDQARHHMLWTRIFYVFPLDDETCFLSEKTDFYKSEGTTYFYFYF